MIHRKTLALQAVKDLAAAHTHQFELIQAVYALVLPVPWDRIEVMKGYPRCNKKTAVVLMGIFMAFDRKHHPYVIPGGAWMNSGFSFTAGGDELEDMVIEVDDAIIQLKKEEK